MSKVKSAFEKAMEKMEAMGSLSEEEREALRHDEKLRALLAAFYKGELTRDGLWQQLRDFAPSSLREAQLSMANTLRLGGLPEEFQLRRDGIIAIESLKKTQNLTALENLLNSMQMIQKEYQEIRESAIAELRQAIEKNPQMRARPMKAPDGRTVYQGVMSVEEALQVKLAEFLPEHERRFETMFSRAAEKLRTEMR